MYFTVYQTVNKLNGKNYIGKHQTKNLDDDYLGSGKHLNYAITKHGRENFTKEILFVFDNEQDMNAKEAELVTESFCGQDTNYNLCPGGQGGWGYNNTKEGQKLREHSYKIWNSAGVNAYKEKAKTDIDFRQTLSENMRKIHKDGKFRYDGFKNRKHTSDTKAKIGITNSIKQSGSKNSQFGSIWITNGTESKKIKNSDIIPEGWSKGRKIYAPGPSC